MHGTVELVLTRVEGGVPSSQVDHIAQEEPLEIRLTFSEAGVRRSQSVAITMRTPGNDAELAAGFLFGEGIVSRAAQIERVVEGGAGLELEENVALVELSPDVQVDLGRLERHFYTTSSCGVCGKTSIDALRLHAGSAVTGEVEALRPEVVHALPRALREAQSVFDTTGGLHAAALFDMDGRLLALREDVGRHNALDKLIGAELRASRLPARGKILLVSGRASFELVQKARMAEVPFMAAIGAPSSLAVTLAEEAKMTLVGFVRDGRFNVYTGAARVAV